MKVLSLFDGMACGMLAFLSAGVEIESYDAYEIDKYAVKTATHNFPNIKEHGDVFTADFAQYKGVDFVVGGSPCTYWSIAQKNNRETEASGMGWELFSQYLRAIKEAEPKYFIYENNKSMSAAIRESIDSAFGFGAVYINSALVSAQNRQRLYWVGKRNADGTYSKVDVKQPKDRGILLKDILETCADIKCLSDREIDYMVRNSTGNYSDRWSYCQKPSESEKALCITANIHKGVPYNVCAERIPKYGIEDKARQLNAHYPNNCGGFEQRIWNENPSKQQIDMIVEPMRVKEATKKGYIDVAAGECVDLTQPNSKTRRGRAMDKKSNCLMTSCQMYQYLGTIEQPIYEVANGYITIKGKQYPIKLADGFYIIRKLTVTECKRLQTVPEWYEFPVSNAQAYKMLGNGWTIDVIAHLINSALTNQTVTEECEKLEQISIFDVV